jgi:hypothetical protein
VVFDGHLGRYKRAVISHSRSVKQLLHLQYTPTYIQSTIYTSIPSHSDTSSTAAMFQNSHNDDRECLPQPYTLCFESASSSTYVNHTSPILGPVSIDTAQCQIGEHSN